MKQIEVIIYVEPTPKGRPKITVIGKHARAYTPAKTRKAEDMIQAMIRQEVMKQGTFDADIPLSLTAFFYRERPKHLPKRVVLPISRPDLDNYAKLLLDALNKYVFPDDSQIVNMNLRKRFAPVGTPPYIHLMIKEELI